MASWGNRLPGARGVAWPRDRPSHQQESQCTDVDLADAQLRLALRAVEEDDRLLPDGAPFAMQPVEQLDQKGVTGRADPVEGNLRQRRGAVEAIPGRGIAPGCAAARRRAGWRGR